jgi:hypothetical protein
MALVGVACIALGLVGTVVEDYDSAPLLNYLGDTKAFFAR